MTGGGIFHTRPMIDLPTRNHIYCDGCRLVKRNMGLVVVPVDILRVYPLGATQTEPMTATVLDDANSRFRLPNGLAEGFDL